MSCSICNSTGRLPFVKDGKTIPNAVVYCECHQGGQEYPYQPEPAMFDFPCSDTFRGFYCNEPPTALPQPMEKIIYRESDLQPVYAQLSWLKRKILERQSKHKDNI